MSELESFFHMGGYALYVWPSFALSAVVLLANVYFSRREYKNVVRETIRRQQAKVAQASVADKQG